MFRRIALVTLLAIPASGCGSVLINNAAATSEEEPAFQPQVATLPAIPAVYQSPGGIELMATVAASDRLDHDERGPAIRVELLELIGRARAQDDLPTLESDPDLGQMAELLARDMLVRDYFAHADPATGEVLADRWIEAAGFVGDMSELIYTSTLEADLLSQETYLRWIGSASHREQILNPNLHWVGIGTARNGDWRVIVALFAEARR